MAKIIRNRMYRSISLKIVFAVLMPLALLVPHQAFSATAAEITALIEQGKFQSALDAVEDTIEKIGRKDRLMQVKGFLHIRLAQLEEAEKVYKGLIERLPEDPEVINNLGVVYQLQKRYPEAVERFKAVIEKFPDFAPSYENLGDTFTHMARDAYVDGSKKVPDSKVLIAKSVISDEFHSLAKNRANQGEGKIDATVSSAQSASTEPVQETTAAETDAVESVEEQLVGFLESWIQGWSSLSTDAYFSHYSRDFIPSSQSLSDWIDHKIDVIGKAEFINISLENVTMEQKAGDLVKVTFDQFYESDSYSGTSYKELELKLFDGEWFILTEI